MTRTRAGAYSGLAALAALSMLLAAGSWSYRNRTLAASPGARGDPLYYVDPMHPAYKSDRPGTAPDCGMALVPVYRDERPAESGEDGRGIIYVDAVRQELSGARVEVAMRSARRHDLRLYGRVEPDETRVYHVNVGMDGFIRDLSTVVRGSRVTRGQWLATFSAPEARTAIQSYVVAVDAAARARAAGDGAGQLDVASAGVQQAEDRLLNIGMSPRQIRTLGGTRVIPAGIEVAAPADGIVLARSISAGERFQRGAELFRIADLRRVWIEADLFGTAIEQVQPGAAAFVHLPGRATPLRADVSSGTVPEFDPATQSLRIRLEADNPELALRPGMFVDVTVAIDRPAAIILPVGAVIDAGLQKRVFVERASGVFEPRTVHTGWRSGGEVEILDGIVPGDRVVVSGAFLFDSESRMRQTRHSTGPR